VEIATGAIVPGGTIAVLPYEDCHRNGPAVTGRIGAREHIRRAGQDLRAGVEIVPAGRRVTATIAAAAVQAGVDLLPVHRPPVVTLLITGDEVITRGTPGPGQVRDSFTGLVGAVTARVGGRLHTSRHLGDDPDVLRAALDTAAGEVVVVSGASSAGVADHLHTVLTAERANWLVHGVACRPGHPQGLAELPDGRWVVSLPGNPFAGLVAALTLLEPLLHALAGRPPLPQPQAPVHGTVKLMPGGFRIVPVRHEDGWRITAGTGSASLHAVAAADALAVLPADWTDGGPAVILALP
jgi:molybdopterin molybdotransferase